ncbi:hypothetical protein AA106555_0717 [Neokomagataea thailandica NBRC 106555]|uniref:Uncharacterized protein n=1 Tax=Neokomagataea thailandica NBRC 106555 TaxID=1223520 RepID=A0ABQ0QNZ3_9PROT|nr:hypothetical protein AA106555_0717 [Neokomagataea thailandica NBRC 106555]
MFPVVWRDIGREDPAHLAPIATETLELIRVKAELEAEKMLGRPPYLTVSTNAS